MQISSLLVGFAIIASASCGLIPAAPAFQATLCGGALADHSEGGIFYKFNEKLSYERELCIWTVTPGPDSSFNGLRFTLISEELAEENLVRIVYPTVDGQIVEQKTFEHGDLSSIDVPATIAFVIFSTEYYTYGKGFILYYEGINIETSVEPLPEGKVINFAGLNGTYKTEYAERNYSVYVFQDSYISPDIYKHVELTVSDFNVGSENGHLDKLDVWGVARETPGTKLMLLVQPLNTISGSSSYYNAPTSHISPQNSQALIVILRGGRSSRTQLTFKWQNS